MRTSFGDTPAAVMVTVAAAVGALGPEPHADSTVTTMRTRNRGDMAFGKTKRRARAMVRIRQYLILPSARSLTSTTTMSPLFCDTDGETQTLNGSALMPRL